MLGQPQPGLGERDPQRLVVVVVVGARLSQAVFSVRAILLDGSHDPAPLTHVTLPQAHQPIRAKMRKALGISGPFTLYDIGRKEQARTTNYCLSEAYTTRIQLRLACSFAAHFASKSANGFAA